MSIEASAGSPDRKVELNPEVLKNVELPQLDQLRALLVSAPALPVLGGGRRYRYKR